MQAYEYKVVAAPNRSEKAPGAKSGPDRFAATLTRIMNREAADGWEYLRADTLPSEERSGLTRRATTVYHTVLVFRRHVSAAPSKGAPAAETRKPLVAEAPEGKAPGLAAAQRGADAPARRMKRPAADDLDVALDAALNEPKPPAPGDGTKPDP